MNIMLLNDTVHTKDILWVSAVTLRVFVFSVTMSVLCECQVPQWEYYVSVRGQVETLYVCHWPEWGYFCEFLVS